MHSFEARILVFLHRIQEFSFAIASDFKLRFFFFKLLLLLLRFVVGGSSIQLSSIDFIGHSRKL